MNRPDKPLRKVALIFGTRPEGVKMAPVVLELQKRKCITTQVIVTAQHREMLDQVLSLFDIIPDKDLDIMEPGQTLTRITTKALTGLETLFSEDPPDLVLTQGDTTTAFTASLAAFYQKIPVGHVEAGLRTDTIYDPFPEEMNRRMISTIASLNFAPTPLSVENLLRFGVSRDTVFLTGNTVIDALMHIVEKRADSAPGEIRRLIRPGMRMLLVEAHRRENLGEPMENICRALLGLVEDYPDTYIIFPVHRNPRVRETVFSILKDHDRISLLEPVDYPALVYLMKESYMILTDSGGIQEEAPSLARPVLVMRRTTERPEGIEAGTAKLAGVKEADIYRLGGELLKNPEIYKAMAKMANPYGDGRAAVRIADAIEHHFQLRSQPMDPFHPDPWERIIPTWGDPA